MENIIDVEFRELSALEDRTTEELKTEANNLWSQMEAIGNIGLMLAAQAGKRLQIIKHRLNHGEFEEWCEENLNFSKSKAEKMMKLAERTSDENSIFSKTETFTDLGISKVWALLAAPEEVVEEVVNNPGTPDMTVKEFKEEIARLKTENEEELKRTKEENHRLNAENQKINALQKEIEELRQQQNDSNNLEEIAEKEKVIHVLSTKLATTKKEAEEAIEKEKKKIIAEKEKAIEEAIKKAEEKAKEKFEEEMELLIEGNRTAASEIDRLKRKLDTAANTDLAVFKVKVDQLQIDFNSCLSSIDVVKQKDMGQADKMYSALRKIIGIMEGQLPC